MWAVHVKTCAALASWFALNKNNLETYMCCYTEEHELHQCLIMEVGLSQSWKIPVEMPPWNEARLSDYAK